MYRPQVGELAKVSSVIPINIVGNLDQREKMSRVIENIVLQRKLALIFV